MKVGLNILTILKNPKFSKDVSQNAQILKTYIVSLLKFKIFRSPLLVCILTLFLCMTVVNAENYCCYSGASNLIPRIGTACGEGEVSVGSFAERPRCDYDTYKRGCQINGKCYETVFGKHIYDYNNPLFSSIKTVFKTQNNIDLTTYCPSANLVPLTSSCSGNYGGGSGVIQQNPGDGGTGTGTQIGEAVDPGDFTAEEDLHKREKDIIFCADTGGPFGLFLSKTQCNDLTDANGNKPCIYNPYLSGYIKVSTSKNPFGMLPTEAGCMPKTEIQSCMDYKTKENCENNIVYDDEKYTKPNLEHCRWIETDDYYNDFSVDGGICIANGVDYNRNYNIEGYTSRQNLVKNPSFEITGDGNWRGTFTINGGSVAAYDGLKSVTIKQGDKISQFITALNEEVAYKTVLALKQDELYTSSDRIVLEITEYNKNFQKVGDIKTYDVILDEYNNTPGAYKLLTFQSHIVSDGVFAVNISISATKDIEIDAINFEIYDESSILADTGVFKPLEIISSQASACELCFDERNLNFCTQEKSNLMGDCSYMVKNLGTPYKSPLPDYLGKQDNQFYDNWTSQSIANSLLYCEMYLTQDKCIDKNNFVNLVYGPLHYYPTKAGETLCKWNDVYGCYKDSDSSNGPDTVLNHGINGYSGRVYLWDLNDDSSANGWSDSFFPKYEKQSDATKTSDLKYSCDSIPPHTYIYFTAQTQEGEDFVVTENFPTDVLGNVEMHLQAYDITPESCKDFELDKKMYIEYLVDNSIAYRFASAALVEEILNIKEYFQSTDGRLMLVEGENNVKIQVKDQSGNIGKPREFTMNVDLAGPNITVTNPNFLTYPVLGPNQILTIQVTDFSDITSCTFALTPAEGVNSNEGIDSTYFTPSGNIVDYSESRSVITSGFEYKFKLPINKTTVNENVYGLTLTCEDVFGQETSEFFPIYVDYNTNFVLIEPKEFKSYKLNTGFLNSSTTMIAHSTDRNLDRCEFDFLGEDGIDSEFTITDSNGDDGFQVKGYNVPFYKNITATLDFETNGEKNISVVCFDLQGNDFRVNMTYYYDTTPPELDDYEVQNGAGGSNTVIKKDDKYYVRNLGGPSLSNKINVSIDGTGSWMSNEKLFMSYFNPVANEYELIDSTRFSDFRLVNESFIGEVDILNFPQLLEYIGEEVEGQEGLYLQKYQLSFQDKAGNTNTGKIELFVDNSNPAFIFHDPIFEIDNKLYTSQINPNIKVTFNTPSYREFECRVITKWKGGSHQNNYVLASELNFKIGEIITSGFDLSEGNAEISLNCKDLYNQTITGSYLLKYDSKHPILNDAYFKTGNDRFLPNKGKNYMYFQDSDGIFLDELVFNLEDTKEDGYTCSYQFTSTDYDCDDTLYNESFISPYHVTSPIPILSDSTSSICSKPADFSAKLETYLNKEETLETQINVHVICEDNVGFKTESIVVPLNLNYVAGNTFINFTITYEEGKAKLKATSMLPFNNVGVYFDSTGEVIFAQLNLEPQLENGLYVYSGEGSTADLESGVAVPVWAIGFGEDSSIWDKIRGELIVDKDAPSIDLSIPDADENNFVYADEFEIVFNSEDKGGSNMGLVEVYINNVKVYDSLNLSDFKNGTILKPDSFTNFYIEDEHRHYGRIILTNAVIGSEYAIKVISSDVAGNKNESIKTVVVKDGVGIRLLDSTDAFVDFNGFSWITKSAAPSVSFRTSRPVEECRLYGFKDAAWVTLLGNADIVLEQRTIDGTQAPGNVFTFDLSSFQGFDLNAIKQARADLGIACKYNHTFYNFNRGIYILNTLPDYVLTSSEGFVLSEDPYETTLKVDSVGFYKYITCTYTIDGNIGSSFESRTSDKFTETISFKLIPGSSHILELECENKLGTKGPTKTYEFIVNRNAPTSIEEVTLSRNTLEYDLDESSQIYVKDTSNFKLSFKSNKKDVLCEVEVESRNDPFGRIVQFISNIFTDNTLDIISSKPYYFEISGLVFSDEGLNKLIVSCDGMPDKTYKVNYLSGDDFDFDLTVN